MLVAALLWFRISRCHGERFEGETWQDRKWLSLMTGVVYLVGFNGTLLLPLSLSYRVGIQALVVGERRADGDRSRDDPGGADD